MRRIRLEIEAAVVARRATAGACRAASAEVAKRGVPAADHVAASAVRRIDGRGDAVAATRGLVREAGDGAVGRPRLSVARGRVARARSAAVVGEIERRATARHGEEDC